MSEATLEALARALPAVARLVEALLASGHDPAAEIGALADRHAATTAAEADAEARLAGRETRG